jgi:hypothetical protein
MKNVKSYKEFESIIINESYDGIHQKLWDFQNKPLLGGYFSDVDSDQTVIWITISKNPVVLGQTRRDIEELGKAYYYPEDKKWVFDNGLKYASDRDKPILDQITSKI